MHRIEEAAYGYRIYFDGFQYDACVRRALNELVEEGHLTPGERQRLRSSARRAFRER